MRGAKHGLYWDNDDRCKKNCDAKPLCPACEDNTIPGFGTSWCEMNVNAAGFCSSSDGTYKCKKTCGLCR